MTNRLLVFIYILLSLVLIAVGIAKLAGHDPLGLSEEQLLALSLLYLTSMGTILLIREFRTSTTHQAINAALAAHLGPYVKSAHVLATVHEKDFYPTWSRQVREAQTAVEITSLTVRPPAGASTEESTYFKEFGSMVGATKAYVRRIERYTKYKKEHIDTLIRLMKGRKNCALAIYFDPADGDEPDEMTLSISTQRLDNKYAWIVALAEHNAITKDVRDIMLTGADCAQLVGVYFGRMWDRSEVIIQNGILNEELWQRIREKGKAGINADQ